MHAEGRHYRTGKPVRIETRDGRMVGIRPTSQDAAKAWLAPSLLDVQVNGYAGVDFQADDLTPERLTTAVTALRRGGVSRFLLTLITDDWEQLLARLNRIRQWRESDAVLRQAIVGWHIEGPFLSGEAGFRGAHEAARMRDPSADDIQALRRVTGPDPVVLTLAPERQGAFAAIGVAVSLGMRVSLGHTNASGEVLGRAVAAGASAFTHLGNGCPQLLDRHDNILWRVAELPGVMVSLIPDGTHVSPPLFRILHRLLPSDRVMYISDAMAAAGAGPGRFRLGRLELEVGEDGVVRLPGSPNFAGSSLEPLVGIARAARMLGVGWREVWDRFSVNPARWLGLRAGLEAGCPADFCLIETNPDGEMVKLRVFEGGAEIPACLPRI